MSESKLETVSLLVDNYKSDDQSLADTLDNADMSDCWDRYHLIGDVMRDDIPESLNLDLSSQVAAAIAEEPTVLAPSNVTSITSRIKAKVISFAKPVGQMAIAASAAGLMIVGVQQNVAENETIVPTQVVQTTPFGGVAQPVSLNFQKSQQVNPKQTIAERQRRFHALLRDHQQQIKLIPVVEADVKTDKKVEK